MLLAIRGILGYDNRDIEACQCLLDIPCIELVSS